MNRLIISLLLFLIPSCLYAIDALPNGWQFVDCIQSVKGAYIDTKISQSHANNSVKLDCLISVTEFGTHKRRLMGFDGRVNNYFGLNADDFFEIGVPSNVKALPNVTYHVVTEQGTNEIKLLVYEYIDSTKEKLLGYKTNNLTHFNESSAKIFLTQQFICEGISVYNFKILIDDVVKAEFKPIRNEISGEAAMYDMVSKRIFNNTGKGYLKAVGYGFSYTNSFLKDLSSYLKKSNDKSAFINNNNEVNLPEKLKAIANSLLISFIILFIFNGVYFLFNKLLLKFDFIVPVFISCLVYIILFLSSLLVEHYGIGLYLIIALSIIGWLKSLLVFKWKFWQSDCFKNVIWDSFLIGLLFLTIISCFCGNTIEPSFLNFLIAPKELILNGHKEVIDLYPCFKVFFPLSQLYFRLLNKFDFNLVFFAYYTVLLSCLLIIFGYIKNNILLSILTLYTFVFSLFLFNLNNMFFGVIGFAITILIAILLHFRSAFNFAKTIIVCLFTLLFIILISLPHITVNLNFYNYLNVLSVVLFACFWIGFSANLSIRAFLLLIPLLMFSLFLSSVYCAFLPILSLIIVLFVLLKRMLDNNSSLSLNLSVILIVFLITIFSIFAYSNNQFCLGNSKKEINRVSYSSLVPNVTKNIAIQWHKDNPPNINKYTSVCNIINGLSSAFQSKPFALNRITIVHVFVLFFLCFAVLSYVYYLSVVRKHHYKCFFLDIKRLSILILPVIVFLANLIIILPNVVYSNNAPLWQNFDLIVFPFIAILIAIIIIFAILIFRCNHRVHYFNLILLLFLLFVIILCYLWLPINIFSFPLIS